MEKCKPKFPFFLNKCIRKTGCFRNPFNFALFRVICNSGFPDDIDLNLTDVTADMSFNNETKEMTVVHNIDESVITIKKTKMAGIIIKYINKSESEHD